MPGIWIVYDRLFGKVFLLCIKLRVYIQFRIKEFDKSKKKVFNLGDTWSRLCNLRDIETLAYEW